MFNPFSSLIDLGLFSLVFITWCLSLILEPFIIKKSGIKSIKSRQDKGTYLLIYLSVFVSIVLSFNLSLNEIYLLPYPFFFAGIVCIILGIIVREYAVITLGKYFSFHIAIMNDHKIIESGLYHYIRHPSYAGGILAITGISIALRSLVAITLVVLICIITYGLRINYEEKIMIQQFNDAYLEYKKRTKMIIPFIL